MLKLDHLTIIAPTLTEGVAHVRDCLGLDVPFGTRHLYMGTHNHRLQLGANRYLEIVALDPAGTRPPRARWFGLDDQERVRADWKEGRRLRGWVASTAAIDAVLHGRRGIFGDKVALPFAEPSFCFAIPADGRLPLDGAAPSLIDHLGDPTSMEDIPDLGARLQALTLEHPDPAMIAVLYRDLAIIDPPVLRQGATLRYHALIETPAGLRELT
ncbi:glyoxalase-like protein [Dongia mobilis]|uniref:Glyoxalase-like protein n=1 Tax=Dongia mobilis TaxID=578943 RepID=A0A4R6WQA0_9PROT|nr:VOC family protein [Dongia mobilis]TDQ81936.1 glyoxalase-like protein [Dongia mobilis]